MVVSIPYRYYKNGVFVYQYTTSSRFQFLIGTIKTYIYSIYITKSILVSIPYRYYKNYDYI